MLILLTTTRIPGLLYRTETVLGQCSVDDLHSCAVHKVKRSKVRDSGRDVHGHESYSFFPIL